jgi:hypothetical protein
MVSFSFLFVTVPAIYVVSGVLAIPTDPSTTASPTVALITKRQWSKADCRKVCNEDPHVDMGGFMQIYNCAMEFISCVDILQAGDPVDEAHTMLRGADPLPTDAIQTEEPHHNENGNGELACFKLDSSAETPPEGYPQKHGNFLFYMAEPEMKRTANKFCQNWAPKQQLVLPKGRVYWQYWVDVVSGISVNATFIPREDGSCPYLDFETETKASIKACEVATDTIIVGCKLYLVVILSI